MSNTHVNENPYANPRRRLRKFLISLFVILWTVVFHYESTRNFYLNPFFKKNCPKVKFLFPPAGWIMFFNVDDSYGAAEVYGRKDGRRERIDPHKILATKAVGYDNIHRNVLSEVLSPYEAQPFCGFLKRKFPGFDEFAVVTTYYPSLTKDPQKKFYKIMYVCPSL